MRRSPAAKPEHAEVRIGARLRAARQQRGFTLQQVAATAGVSKGFVAQVERNEASPSVATLLRVCDALGIAVGSLFEAPRTDLVRRADRAPIEFGGIGVADWMLTPQHDHPLQVILSEIAPGGGGGDESYAISSRHGFVLVLGGEVVVRVGEVEHRLGEGDALNFDPREPHAWANGSNSEPARALWVLTPSPYGRE